MSETYTSSNSLIKPGIGTDAGFWGNELNLDFDLIDTAIDGVEYITLSGGAYNLNIADGAASNGRYKVVIFNGTPGGPVAVSITPVNIQKVYWVVNESSQSVTLSNGSGTPLTVPSNTTNPAFCDGAGNVIGLLSGNTQTTFNGIVDTGNLTVSGITTLVNNTTIDSNLTVLGTTNSSGAVLLGSTLGVSGALSISGAMNVGSQTLAQYIQSQSIPLISLQGTANGQFVVSYFTGTAGSRTAFATGSGVAPNGTAAVLPTGFIAANTAFSAALHDINTFSTAQPLSKISVSIDSSGSVTCTATDNNGHNFTGVATWTASCFSTTY
jgi:hypothetical protein